MKLIDELKAMLTKTEDKDAIFALDRPQITRLIAMAEKVAKALEELEGK